MSLTDRAKRRGESTRASNWLDRLLHGAVVDFLNLGPRPLRAGIFNFADAAIMTGIAILLLSTLAKGEARGGGGAGSRARR